jgi:hypothetical protein
MRLSFYPGTGDVTLEMKNLLGMMVIPFSSSRSHGKLLGRISMLLCMTSLFVGNF